jgi:hypothetical protein
MKIFNIIFTALFSSTFFIVFPVWAQLNSESVKTDQVNFVRFPPFSTLCIQEDATGYNWQDKKWIQTNFKPTQKYIIKKIEIEKYLTEKDRSKNQLITCKNPSVMDFTSEGKKFSAFVDTCYEIKRMGEKAAIWDYQMCSEYWRDGRLEKISCRDHSAPFYFEPDGAFIQFPWHTSLEKTNKEKDSLVLSVGSCSQIR